MLSQPLTLTESDVRGCGLGAESPPPGLPLANAGIFSHTFLPSSPPPVAPCCSCSSLLPRLLAAHRLEVRRLLRGALSSLGRRLDTLERRSRRKGQRKGRNQRGGGSSTFTCSSTSSYKPTPLPSVSTSSSANSYKSPSSFRPSEQRKRRSEEDLMSSSSRRTRKNHEESILLPNRADHDEKEEEGGRFVGQMAVSFRGGGAEKQELLILQTFSQNQRRGKEGGASPAEGVGVGHKRNGSSHYQNAMLVLQATGTDPTWSQSGDVTVSSGQWHFSDIITCPSSNHSVLELWLITSPSHMNSAPVLHLSASAMEMMLNWFRGGACWSPLWHLRDWTPPPSLDSDHCYTRRLTVSPTVSAQRHQKQGANHITRSLSLPRRQSLPLPPCSSREVSGAHQSAAVSGFLSPNIELGKRVSQIRIRRASPKETPLTPMGLPKVKRLKKKEFSLEEIYTNKNYKPPPLNRSLETIFEVPREKDGALLLIGQQKRRRLLLFPDFTQPRKRKKPQGAGFPVFMTPRKRAAVRHLHTTGLDGGGDLDVMLVERLGSLESFLTEQGLHV